MVGCRWLIEEKSSITSVLDDFYAGGRGRTDMSLRPHDFESCASANSATPA